MITINTTRFSTVIKAFVEQYPSAVVRIDNHIQNESPTIWCTNANLQAAINFSLVQNNIELLGFHDGPQNMWAAPETLSFVQTLAGQKLLRFTESKQDKLNLWQKLFAWLSQ